MAKQRRCSTSSAKINRVEAAPPPRPIVARRLSVLQRLGHRLRQGLASRGARNGRGATLCRVPASSAARRKHAAVHRCGGRPSAHAAARGCAAQRRRTASLIAVQATHRCWRGPGEGGECARGRGPKGLALARKKTRSQRAPSGSHLCPLRSQGRAKHGHGFRYVGKACKDLTSGYVYDHKASYATKTSFGASLNGSVSYRGRRLGARGAQVRVQAGAHQHAGGDGGSTGKVTAIGKTFM
jgi:hypothetical protein